MTVDKTVQQSTYYHLRRIGKPATKPNVKNIFVLRKDVTKFGRHSGNDNYIDSAVLDCFISRWHSEIHRILHNDTVHYVLKDKSLNGTYVNNHRVQGNHILQDGEVICFGHTNGKNLKPGEYAPQTDSEFEFIFERASLESDSDVEIVQDVPARGRSPQIADSTTGACDPHVAPHTGVEDLSRTLPSHTTTALSSSIVGTTEGVSTQHTNSKPAPQDRKSPVLQDISNKSTANSTSGLVPLDQIAVQATDSRPAVSCNITVQVTQDKVFSSSSHGKTQATAADSPQQPSQSHDSTYHNTVTDHEPVPSADEPVSRPHASVEKSHSDMHLTVELSEHMKSIAASGSKRKRSTSGGASAKRKGKGKRRHSSETTEEDDDRWHYAGDKCDAFDCTRPVGAKVSWVQCDDCDAWYHIQCARCNYDKVKRKTAEFHCGCA